MKKNKIKELKKRWPNWTAMAICLCCLVLSIANFWLHNETIKFVIYPLLLIAMMLNLYSELIENFKLRNRYLVKARECIDLIWSYQEMGKYIDSLNIPELYDIDLRIENELNDVRVKREQYAEMLGVNEGDE